MPNVTLYMERQNQMNAAPDLQMELEPDPQMQLDPLLEPDLVYAPLMTPEQRVRAVAAILARGCRRALRDMPIGPVAAIKEPTPPSGGAAPGPQGATPPTAFFAPTRHESLDLSAATKRSYPCAINGARGLKKGDLHDEHANRA